VNTRESNRGRMSGSAIEALCRHRWTVDEYQCMAEADTLRPDQPDAVDIFALRAVRLDSRPIFAA
jgi:hypothetical protein